jgi:hypothetical protein
MSKLRKAQSDIPCGKRLLVPGVFSSKDETFLFIPSRYSHRLRSPVCLAAQDPVEVMH